VPAAVETRSTRDKILDEAIQCFANVGFSGVSMRDIARAVSITPAAIYHHFSDKDALYREAVTYAFNFNAESLSLTVGEGSDGSSQEQFRLLVSDVLNNMHADPLFRRIYLREILDGNEARLRILVTEVLPDMHGRVAGLMKDIAPDVDCHMVMVSLAGLVLHHLETIKISLFMPDGHRKHQDPDSMDRWLLQLLVE